MRPLCCVPVLVEDCCGDHGKPRGFVLSQTGAKDIEAQDTRTVVLSHAHKHSENKENLRYTGWWPMYTCAYVRGIKHIFRSYGFLLISCGKQI